MNKMAKEIINGKEYEVEYGSSSNFNCLKSENVKAYDRSGKEIDNPKCDLCGDYKIQLISMNGARWICTNNH